MLKSIKLGISCGLLMFSMFVFAANPKSVVYSCPEPSLLQTKQSLLGKHGSSGAWVVGDKAKGPNKTPFIVWQSYGGLSFAIKIVKFERVQWQGVKVGKVICLYGGVDKYGHAVLFPIALKMVHPILIAEPTGSNWLSDKYGYKSCISDNVKDCTFNAVMRKKQEDIFKFLWKSKLKNGS